MRHTLRRVRAEIAGDRGFTLIELLVVVVIIGILVGISVPVYLNYTKGAANKSAQSDVRGAIPTLEQYYTENAAYPASKTGTEGTAVDLGKGYKMTVSPGNTLQLQTNGNTYVVCGRNKDGQTVYKFDSAAGGSVSEYTGSLDACAKSGGSGN
jgi:type IV pilus assembly protein PilA